MMKFGNLVIAGIVTGSIYAVFAVCVAVWYRVCNILNLAVGDFAMIGALGVDYLFRVENWPLPLAIAGVLAAVAAFGYCYDRVVLSLAQDRRRQEGIVVTFFFTFALSFFIEGVAQILFGTNVHAAPALWPGNSLSLGSRPEHRARRDPGPGLRGAERRDVRPLHPLHAERQGDGGLRRELPRAPASSASTPGVPAGHLRGHRGPGSIFGIVESPITGYTYISGAVISLTGFIAAAYGGFRSPGPGPGGRARDRDGRGAARRVRQRGIRRHAAVRAPRRPGPGPAPRPGLRVSGQQLSRGRR